LKKLKVYLETSVVNFLISKEKDEKVEFTRILFEQIERGEYEAYISDLVIQEIRNAPEEKQKELVSIVKKYSLPILPHTDEATELAEEYMKEKIIPQKYFADAIHIGISVVNNIDILLSWNYEHIVKIKTIWGVNGVNRRIGYKEIEIRTPEEVVL